MKPIPLRYLVPGPLRTEGRLPPVRTYGLVLLGLLTVAFGCSSSTPSLTPIEMQKLDPAIQRLLCGDTLAIDHYSTSRREDGTTVYSVIIRTDDPEALGKAGIPVGSVKGDMVTARLSIEEIRDAARIDAVRRIENPARHQPTP